MRLRLRHCDVATATATPERLKSRNKKHRHLSDDVSNIKKNVKRRILVSKSVPKKESAPHVFVAVQRL